MSITFRGVPGFLAYFGIGALCLAIAEGSAIDWSAAWTYVWLLAWPIGLIAVFLKWAAILFAALIVLGIIISVYEWFK